MSTTGISALSSFEYVSEKLLSKNTFFTISYARSQLELQKAGEHRTSTYIIQEINFSRTFTPNTNTLTLRGAWHGQTAWKVCNCDLCVQTVYPKFELIGRFGADPLTVNQSTSSTARNILSSNCVTSMCAWWWSMYALWRLSIICTAMINDTMNTETMTT